jgi:hypothetical protein
MKRLVRHTKRAQHRPVRKGDNESGGRFETERCRQDLGIARVMHVPRTGIGRVGPWHHRCPVRVVESHYRPRTSSQRDSIRVPPSRDESRILVRPKNRRTVRASPERGRNDSDQDHEVCRRRAEPMPHRAHSPNAHRRPSCRRSPVLARRDGRSASAGLGGYADRARAEVAHPSALSPETNRDERLAGSERCGR